MLDLCVSGRFLYYLLKSTETLKEEDLCTMNLMCLLLLEDSDHHALQKNSKLQKLRQQLQKLQLDPNEKYHQ